MEKKEENYKEFVKIMLSLFYSFQWIIKTGKSQKTGSVADIYAEMSESDGSFTMLIDDGNCHNELYDAIYHIYAPGGKIFEGRITSPSEFSTVMKVLGFEEKEIKDEFSATWREELKKVANCPQRQDSLSEQLKDLRIIANKFGFYDAADFLKRD